MINWVYVVILGLVVGFLSAMFDWPFVVSISIILVFALCSIGYMFYIAYASTDLAKIRKYIVKHKKDPVMNYIHTLEVGTKEQEIEAMEKIIAHYKQPVIKNTYEMNRAIRLDDFERAQYYADQLMDNQNGPYGKALIAAVAGNREEANSYSLKSEWMKYGIEAQLALAERNLEAFDRFAQQSVEAAKGLQRYSLYYSFKKAKLEYDMESK